jgi:hypothetical protein
VPTIRLSVGTHGADIPVQQPGGGIIDIPRSQFRCLIELPGHLLPQDAIIDTGAPLIIFPELIWSRFQVGADYDFLPFVGTNPPTARVGNWQFTYQIARFRVPLAVMDAGLTTRVPRPGVIAQFATGNPTGLRSLPVVVGLWGGILEGGRIGIDRNAQTNRARGELTYP